MIQRIQTIYLLISLMALSLLFFNPIIGFTNDAAGSWQLFLQGIKETSTGKVVTATLPLVILFGLSELLGFLSVIAYKRRALQMRMTAFNMILQILSYGIIALYVFQGKNHLGATPHLLFFSIMPLLAAICSYLAFRGIRRDIYTLKALDRLR